MKGLSVSGHLISGRDFPRALCNINIICPPILEILPTPLLIVHDVIENTSRIASTPVYIAASVG